MKVQIELDTNDPVHRQLLSQFLDGGSQQVTTAAQPVAPATQVPSATPAPQIETQPVSQTPPGQLSDRLQALFSKAYASRPDEAMAVAQRCREEFGADNNTWSEQQWNEAFSRMESLITF